jgi:SAM-dependent methyltransferase
MIAGSAVAATLGARVTTGPYAASAATGLAWAATMFALVGGIGSGTFAAYVLLVALSTTLGSIPVAEFVRSRLTASSGPATSEAVDAKWATHLRQDRVPIAIPRNEYQRVGALCVALAVAGLVASENAFETETPLSSGPAMTWVWVAGWIAVQSVLVQRLVPTLAIALALVATVCAAHTVGGALDGSLLGVALALPLVVRHSLTTPLMGRALEVATAAVLTLAAASLLLPRIGPEAGTAALLAGLGGLATIAAVWVEDRRAPVRAASVRLATVRRALHRLDPYPRWYGISKLAADPLYRTLDAIEHHWGAVLDIGAGMGLEAAVIARDTKTRSLTLVDLDAEKLVAGAALLRALGRTDENTRLVAGSYPHPATAEQRFDTVLLFDVLHYAPRDAQLELLSSAARQLAEGGRMLVRDPVAPDGGAGHIGRMERWTTRFGFNPIGRTRFLTDAEWAEAFARCGLVEVERQQCGHENVLFTLARAT